MHKTTPAITASTDSKYLHFEVETAHTPVLITYLRKHLNGFQVKIGFVEFSSTEVNSELDVFYVHSAQVNMAVLTGLLDEFYKIKSLSD
jgi:hypothetical protein